MIVTSKNDVVELSGSLHKNQWLAIKAAAKLLLRQHPQGILIDCSELEEVSEDGAKTFLDAMKDIQGEGARIIVCNLPDNVLRVVRSVPGVRSQLPIAKSVEEARASLRLGGSAAMGDAERPPAEKGVLIPLVEGLDVDYAVTIAARLSREMRLPVLLVYLLAVGRNLPLNTPLAEQETAANRLLERAEQAARRQNLAFARYVERVRDVEEGVLQAIKNYKAGYVVLGAFADHAEDDLFHTLVETLLHRAPCNVLIGRKALAPNGGTPAALRGEI
jgi:anti-anti-sigma regulatory factor